MVTLNPRALRRHANDDDMIPLPSDDTTPPVTKIYLVSTLDNVIETLQLRVGDN